MPTEPFAPATGPGTEASPRSPHRLSVAMCTFEGARFLVPQLDSLQNQTRRPDELVVCDDGSTDNTLEVLREFAKRASFPVRIEQNPTRLGSTKNFEKAIGLCTGDLIATCDQDDVWLPDKLALSEAAIDLTPERGLIFTDSEVVDDDLRSRGHTLWNAIRFGELARRRVRCGRAFDVLLRRWVVTGTTMMFRARFRPYVLPIPENWVHDGWIAFILAAMAPIGFIERPTLRYRQHPAQQIGGKKFGLRELYRKARDFGVTRSRLDYERFQLARDRLASLPAHLLAPGVLDRVERKVEHHRRRLAIAEAHSRRQRVVWTLRELACWGYQRYSATTLLALRDLLL